MEEFQVDLEKEYTTPENPGAFSGKTSFLRELQKRFEQVDKTEVDNLLSNKEAYTLHRPVKKKFIRNRVIVSGKDDTFQMDLVDVSSIASFNDRYKFILSCIDVFSKYAWAVPLKNKSSDSVLEAVKKIFASGRIPQRIQTDQGKEFINKRIKQYLSHKKVKLYILNSEMKACVVERFNRTLKEKMWRYFTHKHTYRYIDQLEKFISSYNHSHHRSIKMAPVNVNEENESTVFKNLYGYNKEEGDLGSVIEFKFKVGDLVRLSKSKSIFEKGYTANWTRELFKIHERIPRVPPVYKVVDTHPKPEILQGVFYEDELQKVSNDDEIFHVEKVLKTRTNKKGEREEFVKWVGYPDKFNSWIKVSDIVENFDNDDNINLDEIENNKNSRIEFSI